MSCNLIQIQGGKKVARPVTSEEEYRQLRGTSAQLANLRLARNGNAQASKVRSTPYPDLCRPFRTVFIQMPPLLPLLLSL